jgi:hypothetical protein
MEGLIILFMVLCIIFWSGRYSAEKAPSVKMINIAHLPLTEEQWNRFCHLAAARGVQQKTLLADAIKFYLQEKIR